MRRCLHLLLIVLLCGFGSLINNKQCSANSSDSLTSVVQTDSSSKDSVKSQETAASTEQQKPAPEPGMCGFCHLNAVSTWQSSKHFARNIDCIACHGESADHIRVEDNTIKPTIYYTQGGTTDLEFCQKHCHKKLPQEPHKDIQNCVSCHEAHTFAKP